MKRTLLGDLVVLSVAGVLVTGSATAVLAGGSEQPAAGSAAATAARKACIDPATGKLVSPDERPECRVTGNGASSAEGSVRQSGEGLEQEAMPDGSTKMDLDGRFQQNRAPAAPPQQSGGRIALIDPQTGELMTGEAPARLGEREDLQQMFEEFDARLEEVVRAAQDVSGLEEERLASGAVKLDLEGRFRSPLVATVDHEGAVAMRHGSRAGGVAGAD